MQSDEPTTPKEQHPHDRPRNGKQAVPSNQAKDTTAAAKLLSSDFTFSGPVPQPINGTQWLAMQQNLATAFPDWKFNVADLREEGGKIRGAVQITGTHKGELDLSTLGMPNVPATGKAVKLPARITLTFQSVRSVACQHRGDRRRRSWASSSQLGVKLP
jgi:predicted ester cyclase